MNFKKSIFSVLFAFIITLQLHASHIVGGEVTLKRMTGNSYRITLNLYFDLINGNPAAQDPYVQVTFYDKSSNKLLDTVYVFRTSYTDIPTEKGICNYIKLQTRKLVYTKDTILDPSKYNGNQGFYAAWTRCCRNAAAENIINPANAAIEMFSSVEIYNRWGTKVFNDNKRGFQWDASDVADGVYYYLLKYNKLVLKSWLQIIR